MSDTVILGFEATAATLHTGFSKELSNAPSITYRLKHEQRQKVSTADGVDLTELEWSIQVYATEKYNEHAEKSGGIGFMGSLNSEGACHISAAIGKSAFDRLARTGRLPAQITVHARDLMYGKDYNGADIVWPKPEDRSIVTDVAFSIPLTDVPDSTGNSTADTKVLEVARQATKLLYVVAIAVVLIGLRLYFR